MLNNAHKQIRSSKKKNACNNSICRPVFNNTRKIPRKPASKKNSCNNSCDKCKLRKQFFNKTIACSNNCKHENYGQIKKIYYCKIHFYFSAIFLLNNASAHIQDVLFLQQDVFYLRAICMMKQQ